MPQNDMITLDRDIHCPYCAQIKGYENNRNAILINKHDGRQWSLGLPFETEKFTWSLLLKLFLDL